ncbi:Peptidoglycan/LPS O-acetylase OafA/YrhL, contains acyltransferase and SGNH-hydrolase domains [Nonomuraea solani]|uniref:Peptidoglycan/LPS O-acetylase OafA/YrhL, contains acyltransferase and SGNH-hydrolase domains n=1 Tax=Nonomuraea solani TaxID=1144553 RepID=A0A1H6EZU3_9ACTN|nr:acyltransferase [Nonomuraea solani]SEH02486.1 Peptidoglycan/LPS O-acetylase OafA/YrhL, contains acyltransferase and SGNH-hydrolase domains [Nonomuraea solani]
MRDLLLRVHTTTPADRDRGVDGLRALAILGVVLGHWLVTALVADSGTMSGASPLRDMPYLAPVSWVFQTLAVFFLVGGLVAARSRGSTPMTYREWLGGRLARLFRPVAAVVAVWTVVAVTMLAAGTGLEPVRTLARLVWSPLWFLLVFAALTAATPLAARLHPAWPLTTVALIDLLRYGLGGPAWLGSVNVLAGWLVPYCLGTNLAGNPGVTYGGRLLVGGGVVTVALVFWGGYPAAMVGVPGAVISNLDPPTLAAVTFGLAQCGAALLVLGPLRRALARPFAWAAVALVNLSAITIFLWHQTAMIAVTTLGLLTGHSLPGLHTAPGSPAWVLARLAWLPVFGVALAVCWAAFRGYERPRRKWDHRPDRIPYGESRP